MNPRTVILVFLLIAASLPMLAQSDISGRILNEQKQALPGAGISVLREKDSTVEARTGTDSNGVFHIRGIMAGNYLIRVSLPGTMTIYKIITARDTSIDLGDIMLSNRTETMREATVFGQKKLLEVSGDKVIMNLAGNAITAGLNGLELLEKLPGVTVNRQTESIQMNGKAGVMLMVDDRQTYLTGQQLSNYLKTLRSDDIEKVEIVSNPSSRYEASGTSGIINLKTRKNKAYGTSYTIDAGFRYATYRNYGNYPQDNQGFSVNVRQRKFSLYANLSHNHVHEYWANDNDQLFFGTSGATIERRSDIELEKGRYESWNGKINLDYSISKRSTVGISLNGSFFDGQRNSDLLELSQKSGSEARINTSRQISDKFQSYVLNTHWGHNFDSTGTQLSVDLDIIFDRTLSTTDFNTTVAKDVQDSISLNGINSKIRTNSYILTVDFQKRWGKSTRMEIGLKTRFAGNKNDYADNFVANGPLLNSFFEFNENLEGAYVVLSRQLDSKTRLQAGVRAEQTNNRGLDAWGNRLTGQNYLNIFPTFAAGRKISANHFASITYSRRINRPASGTFNIFRKFGSALSYSQGNPYILPALYNSFSVSDLIKNRYLIELSYVNVQRFLTGVFDIDSTLIPGRNLVRNSFENVGGKVSWWNLKILLPLDLKKWWALNTQAWAGINAYDYFRKEAHVQTTQFYWGASVQQNFNVTATLSLQLGGWINSGETSGFKTNKPTGSLDIGCRKLVLQRNGAVKVSLQDPFNFNYNRSTINAGYYTGNGVYRWNNRMLIAGFSYNFGNRDVRINKWQTKYRENNADGKN